MTDYNYRNCQSLFGYAAKVHERSGGVCQLCGAGTAGLDFDLWRQMTVEHLLSAGVGHEIDRGVLHDVLLDSSLSSRAPRSALNLRSAMYAAICASASPSSSSSS